MFTNISLALTLMHMQLKMKAKNTRVKIKANKIKANIGCFIGNQTKEPVLVPTIHDFRLLLWKSLYWRCVTRSLITLHVILYSVSLIYVHGIPLFSTYHHDKVPLHYLLIDINSILTQFPTVLVFWSGNAVNMWGLPPFFSQIF